MNGEKKMFSSFETNDESNENIVFGDNSEGKVMGLGEMAISMTIPSQMFFLSIL